jgi:hypothetical protein
MGYYADMCIDSTFNDYYDRIQGCGKYSDQSLIDDWDDDDDPTFAFKLSATSCWKIKGVIAETV